MPRNNELNKILLIGSGPIVIGQGCEFDYSGVQACKALREEGYQVVLVNSNPATIMTDPEFADRTYIEPITAEVIEAIIEREKPDAILPTLGGQTALNAAMELDRNGALARHGVKLIGANAQAIASLGNKKNPSFWGERLYVRIVTPSFSGGHRRCRPDTSCAPASCRGRHRRSRRCGASGPGS